MSPLNIGFSTTLCSLKNPAKWPRLFFRVLTILYCHGCTQEFEYWINNFDCSYEKDKFYILFMSIKIRILILPHWFSWFFTNYIFFLVKKATYLYCLYSFYTVTGDLFTFGIQSHPLNFECLESCTFKKCHIFVMLMQFL